MNIPLCQTPFGKKSASAKVDSSPLLSDENPHKDPTYNRFFVYLHATPDAALHLANLLYTPLSTIPTSLKPEL